ncbi:MAG TPA: SLBB domain-containing protein [Candidatus Acidoferrum sp.]|jgi:polysaccharide export outer membrane protein|nr:SLBB domain-containing protein [Candidatus Acidoferrum sp.]
MKNTIILNRVCCGGSGEESLRDWRIESLPRTFHASIRWVFTTSLLFGFVVFAGCRNGTPQFSNANFGAPGSRAAVSQIETTTLTNDLDRGLLEVPTRMFTLGPGDRLELELMGDPASRTMTVVAPDGKLYFNLVPGVDVWGLTLTEAKTRLENTFTNYVREQPRIAMTLRGVESKRLWVLGCVQAPGVYAMATPITLLDSISMAGGTLSMTSFRDQAAAGIGEELADLKRSFVLRQGKFLPVDFNRLLIDGDLSQNIYLEPDDFVYLPAATAREVYVLGAVTQPRPVPYTEGMTVAGAVAGAYGTLRDAYLPHVAVVRGTLAAPQLTIVNYRKILRGEASDMLLQAHDIVYVPLSPYRYVRRYVEVILNTFVSATAINAGSYAVTKQAAFTGGVFIPVGSGIQIIPPVSPTPPR